jgi:ubiquinone/menaquinone biosynthesis C-methylase UbiE
VDSAKKSVHDFWNEASCGEKLYLTDSNQQGYIDQAKIRYELEGDMIIPFACFSESKDLKVLEVGVGLGADHQKFAEAGVADLYGIDLTEKAVEHTRKRLESFDLLSNLSVGDAEALDFPDETFDLVYSWGVLHHSPDTPKAISEVLRVLRIGGRARIMIYHKLSLIGYMLWVRYALLRLNPWLSLSEIYSKYLESPGTKAYSLAEAKELFSGFRDVKIKTPLGHGDLLESDVGQLHRGVALTVVKKLWPRWLIRRVMANSGLFMLIEARK